MNNDRELTTTNEIFASYNVIENRERVEEQVKSGKTFSLRRIKAMLLALGLTATLASCAPATDKRVTIVGSNGQKIEGVQIPEGAIDYVVGENANGELTVSFVFPTQAPTPTPSPTPAVTLPPDAVMMPDGSVWYGQNHENQFVNPTPTPEHGNPVVQATPTPTNAQNIDPMQPPIAFVKSATDENPVVQQTRVSQYMTFEDYKQICSNAKKYLSARGIEYLGIEQDIQNLVFMANKEFINQELEQLLIDNGLVTRYELILVQTDPNNPNSYQKESDENWMIVDSVTQLINEINDYNHERVEETLNKDRRPASFGDNGLANRADIAVFLYEQHDKEEASAINGYIVDFCKAIISGDKNDIIDNSQIAHDALTSVTYPEVNGNQLNNVSNMNVGARWLTQRTYGEDHMHFDGRYMLHLEKRSVLDDWFDPGSLNGDTFYEKYVLNKATKEYEIATIDYEKIKNQDLAHFVSMWFNMRQFIRMDVNTTLYDMLGKVCLTQGELAELRQSKGNSR